MNNKKAAIEIMSIMDWDVQISSYEGEIGRDGETWMAAYTDWSGNTSTKNGLYIGSYQMLLHRTGGITCDMLFDPAQKTSVSYDTFGLQTEFVLTTQEYRRDITDGKIVVTLKYTLDDQSCGEPISGQQTITIAF